MEQPDHLEARIGELELLTWLVDSPEGAENDELEIEGRRRESSCSPATKTILAKGDTVWQIIHGSLVVGHKYKKYTNTNKTVEN